MLMAAPFAHALSGPAPSRPDLTSRRGQGLGPLGTRSKGPMAARSRSLDPVLGALGAGTYGRDSSAPPSRRIDGAACAGVDRSSPAPRDPRERPLAGRRRPLGRDRAA